MLRGLITTPDGVSGETGEGGRAPARGFLNAVRVPFLSEMKFAGFATSRARKSSSGSEPDDAVSAAASGRSAAWMNETPRVLFECFSREVFELQSSSRSMASGATARGAFVAALSELFSDSITLSNALEDASRPTTRPMASRTSAATSRSRALERLLERISLRDAPPYAAAARLDR